MNIYPKKSYKELQGILIEIGFEDAPDRGYQKRIISDTFSIIPEKRLHAVINYDGNEWYINIHRDIGKDYRKHRAKQAGKEIQKICDLIMRKLRPTLKQRVFDFFRRLFHCTLCF